MLLVPRLVCNNNAVYVLGCDVWNRFDFRFLVVNNLQDKFYKVFDHLFQVINYLNREYPDSEILSSSLSLDTCNVNVDLILANKLLESILRGNYLIIKYILLSFFCMKFLILKSQKGFFLSYLISLQNQSTRGTFWHPFDLS